MTELLQETLKPYNLPLTFLVLLHLLYWCIALMGVFDLDLSVDVDADADAGDSAESGGGILAGLIRLVGLADVPLILGMTLFSLFLWASNLLANMYFNPASSLWVAGILIIPALIISVIFTRLIAKPLQPLFKLLEGKEPEVEIIGRQGTVTSASITHEFGRIEVSFDGRSLLLNAVLSEGDEPVIKGASVLVVSRKADTDTYIVRSLADSNERTIDQTTLLSV